MENTVQTISLKQTRKKPFAGHRNLWIASIFVVSLLFRLQDFYVFREFNADKAHQLYAAYEWLQGKGISLESYDLNTLEPHTRPLISWPPAYSFLIAGISKISGLSVYGASWVLDVITLMAMWFVLLWFALRFRFTLLQTGVLFLLFGFCRTPWLYLWSSDTLGTVLFLYAAAFNVHVVEQANSRKRLLRFALLQFLLIATMCFLKYSLLPAYVSLALSVFTYAWKRKTSAYQTGFILLAIIVISLALLMLYNKAMTGQNTEIGSRNRKGFFVENLLMFNAFLINAFVYLDGFLQRAHSYSLEAGLRIVNGLMVLFILFRTAKRMMAAKADYFEHLAFWTTVGICGFLSFMSIYFPREVFIKTYFWTYVKELRYFAPSFFLLMILLIRNFHPRIPRSAFSAFAFFFVGIAAVFSLGLNGYYKLTNNRAGSFDNMSGRIIRASQFAKEYRDSNTYFVSLAGNQAVDAQVTALAAINGAKVTFTYDGYFPDAYLSPLFSKTNAPVFSQKVILYLNENDAIADSLNPALPRRMEQNSFGEKFLVINP